MKIIFELVKVPNDGNCLFHAISIPLDINYRDLRKFIPIYIEQNKYKKINNDTLNNWIKMKSNSNWQQYCETIKNDKIRGSSIELMIISKIFNINIFIINKNKKIKNSFLSKYNSKNIFLQYHNNHYNYLKVIENKSDIRT